MENETKPVKAPKGWADVLIALIDVLPILAFLGMVTLLGSFVAS